MTEKLHGPFDELYELMSSADGGGGSTALFAPTDPELLDRLLLRFMEDPAHYRALCTALPSLPRHGDVRAIRLELARQLASGGLSLRYDPERRPSGILPGVTIHAEGEVIEHRSDDEEPAPRERAWRFECSHHTRAAARDVIEHEARIEVVPDQGELSDLVKIHVKDDFRSPPPALLAGGEDVPKTGSSDGYDVYDFDARYQGDVSQTNFLKPRFWSAYRERTTYAISRAPNPLSVVVFNPKRYKFEFKFPEMKSMKYGSMLANDADVQGGRLVTANPVRVPWNRHDSEWKPSSLSLDVPPDPPDAPLDSISFSIDDTKQEIDVAKLIGAILNTAEQVQRIVDAIQDNAPKVGWYMDMELQLMQGGVAIEWYWKEHTDHRAFQYIDVNVEMTIVSIAFELGIGVSGLGFGAQVFAQLGGGLSVSVNGRRDDPSWTPGFALPAKADITGAIGVRVEAGNFFQAEGKGETGIEVNAEIGINQEGRALSAEANISWTGIKVVATVKGGLFGIGGERTFERVLAGPQRLRELSWPRAEEYAPPRMSRDAMKHVLLGVITDGLNVRVIRVREGWFELDEHWSSSEIADVLADVMDAHRTFSRKPKVVEGIAHSIRQDLDRLGARSYARDYIEESAFLAYARGPRLQAHLEAAVPPEAALAAAAGL